MNTLKLLSALAAIITFGIAPAATAQEWPTAPVRIVVPYPPGGAGDVLARKLGEKLAQNWRQPVLIDNKPGASEIIGAAVVVKAKPDGYTLFISTEAALETNQFIYPKLTYNPVKDFTPITRLTEAPFVYFVRDDSPYQSLQQLLADAKKNPGKITYGSNGVGGSVQIAANWLGIQAGRVDMLAVPYQGAVPQLQGVMGGDVHFTLLPAAAIEKFVADKRVRPLATTGATRLRSMPDVPTTIELGYKDTVVNFMFALTGPANLPTEIARKIARDVAVALRDPEFVAKNLEPFGFLPVGESPDEFSKFLAVDRDKQRERVKAANVKLD